MVKILNKSPKMLLHVKVMHGSQNHKKNGNHSLKKIGIEFELERIERDLGKFGVSFDSWVSEKSVYDNGSVVRRLEEMKANGETYEKDDALWFASTKYGDDKDRVLIKSDGSYTYLVPDIAYHLYKLERGYQRLLNLWGGDHHGYIPRMNAALESFGYKDVMDVDIIQMVRLVENGEEVKMSKRTGNVSRSCRFN
ncbi:arginine--tRNA ligase [Erysipelothrix sp. D19-032]